MAYAAAPKGLIPLNGKAKRYKALRLDGTRAATAIYPGEIMIRVAGGGFDAHRTDTANTQVLLGGVSAEYVTAANTKEWILCHDIRDRFLVQSSLTGDNHALAALNLKHSLVVSTAPNTTHMHSKVALGAADASDGCVIVEGLAPMAGNTAVVTNYPWLIVSFDQGSMAEVTGI